MSMICERFRHLGTKYLIFEAQAEARVDMRRIRADLLALARYLRQGNPFVLGMLHWSVEDALLDTWLTLRMKDISFANVLLTGDRTLLLKTTVRATRRLPQRTGRRRTNVNLSYLVSGLCDLYTEVTGRKVTHNTRDKGINTGRPSSSAGRFVVGCVRLIRHDIPETAISQSLAKRRASVRR